MKLYVNHIDNPSLDIMGSMYRDPVKQETIAWMEMAVAIYYTVHFESSYLCMIHYTR